MSESLRPDQLFRHTKEARGEVAVFRCRGAFSQVHQVDLNRLAAEVHDVGAKRVVLDMAEILQIDSAGIGLLATIYKQAHSDGRDLRIVPSTPVRLALGLVKIDKLLRLNESLDAALAD